MKRAKIIEFIGLPGTGKSTLANEIFDDLNNDYKKESILFIEDINPVYPLL